MTKNYIKVYLLTRYSSLIPCQVFFFHASVRPASMLLLMNLSKTSVCGKNLLKYHPTPENLVHLNTEVQTIQHISDIKVVQTQTETRIFGIMVSLSRPRLFFSGLNIKTETFFGLVSTLRMRLFTF